MFRVGTEVKQLWIVEGKLVYSGPYLPLPGGSLPSGKLNYGFYSDLTGDVWGKRLNAAGGGSWIFTPGQNSYPDIRLGYEINAEWMPDEYFVFLLDYLLSTSA